MFLYFMSPEDSCVIKVNPTIIRLLQLSLTGFSQITLFFSL